MPLHQPKFGLTEDECLSLEGRLALVTEVVLNKLGQPTVYKLEVSGRQMLCKSKLAEKYFEKVKK
jgi:hypothetical protein